MRTQAKLNKETEKAINVTIWVSWNGVCRQKDFWMPKSVATFESGILVIEDWFAEKMERDNQWKGYLMYIGIENAC